MPKKLLATIIILTTILASVVNTIGFEEVEANPFPQSTISIISPQPYNSFIYQNTTISLVIQLDLLVADTLRSYSPQITHVTYSLDAKDNITISDIPKSGTEYSEGKDIFGRVEAHFVSIEVNVTTLSNLSEGQHTIKAYSFDINNGVMSTSVTFVVVTTYKLPKVEIISPIDQVYRNSEIPLTCIITGDYKQLCYAIDYRYNITIGGNTTINVSGLTSGCHTIKIYAYTPGRYDGSNLTHFIVGSPINNPSTNSTDDSNPASSPGQNTPTINTGLPIELNPTIIYIILAIVIVIVAVVSVSLVYFKERMVKP